jgi:CubicO group peptidase (beta-lactamase class C family)
MAASEDDLRAALEKRFKGDRSDACIAAAVIENGSTARAYFCANAKSERSIDERTAFEIGSITKTMTAALLAEIIGRGEIGIDDPLAKLLPPGTNVPSFNGTHITVGNIVTHTSGLPSFPWRTTDLSNPYARLTEADLLDTLAKTQLKRAPGSQREESNFALMVLSYAPCQAQRQGLRDVAARASALTPRHGRHLHRHAPVCRPCCRRPLFQQQAHRAVGRPCRPGRRWRRAGNPARHGALPRRSAWHAR